MRPLQRCPDGTAHQSAQLALLGVAQGKRLGREGLAQVCAHALGKGVTVKTLHQRKSAADDDLVGIEDVGLGCNGDGHGLKHLNDLRLV